MYHLNLNIGPTHMKNKPLFWQYIHVSLPQKNVQLKTVDQIAKHDPL